MVAGVEHRVVGAHGGALVDEAPGEDDRGRLTQIVGLRLEGEAEKRHRRAAELAETAGELAEHAAFLQGVDLDHGVEQLEVVAAVAGELLERLHVLREAGAAVADAGLQEVRTDAVIETHAVRHGAHVGAHLFADVGDLVDEGDLGGEKGVGGVLDHLRGRHAGAHDVGVDAAIQRLDEIAVLRAGSADHDAVGLEEVLDGGALAEELRVGHVGDAGGAQRLEVGHHLLAGADRHGALHDEQPPAAARRDLASRVLHPREVGVARRRRRRVDGDEEDVAGVEQLVVGGRERQPRRVVVDELVEAGLVDGHVALPRRAIFAASMSMHTT